MVKVKKLRIEVVVFVLAILFALPAMAQDGGEPGGDAPVNIRIYGSDYESYEARLDAFLGGHAEGPLPDLMEEVANKNNYGEDGLPGHTSEPTPGQTGGTGNTGGTGDGNHN